MYTWTQIPKTHKPESLSTYQGQWSAGWLSLCNRCGFSPGQRAQSASHPSLLEWRAHLAKRQPRSNTATAQNGCRSFGSTKNIKKKIFLPHNISLPHKVKRFLLYLLVSYTLSAPLAPGSLSFLCPEPENTVWVFTKYR